MTRHLLLLTSYCGEDDEGCTDALPCYECLKMCNVLIASQEQVREMQNIGGLEYNSALPRTKS